MFNVALYFADMVADFFRAAFKYIILTLCGVALMIFLLVMFTDGKCTECEEREAIEKIDEQTNLIH